MNNDMKSTERYIKEIQKEYIKAYNNINKEIKSLYGSVKDTEKITMKDLDKNISKDELLSLKSDLVKLIKSSDRFDRDKALTLELMRLNNKHTITRLENLQANIVSNMYQLAKVQEEKATDLLTEVFKEDYVSSLYDFYKDDAKIVINALNKNLIGLSNKDISIIIKTKWSGNNYSDSIWKREYNIANKLQEKMVQHMLRGSSVDRLSRELKKELKVDSVSNVKRLIQTETSYVNNQATLQTYEDLGFNEYKILATLDSKTSSICQEQDSKVYKTSEAVVGVNYPPFHPNCRTTTVSVNKYNVTETRAGRSLKGNITVPANMNYKEFKEKILNN